MRSCPNCGAPAEGHFCAACGKRVEPGAASAPGAAAVPVTEALPENVAAALCYVLGFITGILFLVIAPFNQNRTVRFHAFQSILFNVAIICFWIVLGPALSLFAAVPFVGWFIGVVLTAGVAFAIFICWLVLMWKAYSKEKWVLPVIGPFAEKQA